MANELVRAAVIILSKLPYLDISNISARVILSQEVSRFMQSLQDFPNGPLAFSLETYRDFFVLVAEWRNEDIAIDARYTIDAMRDWIETATDEERKVLDQQLVREPDMWAKPCRYVKELLDMLAEKRGGDDDPWCGQINHADGIVQACQPGVAIGETVNQRCTILSLLGIALDIMAAEMDYSGHCEDESGPELLYSSGNIDDGKWFSTESHTAYTILDLCWRKEVETRVAAGVIERLRAREKTLSFDMSAEVAIGIVLKLQRELQGLGTTKQVDEGDLKSTVVPFFRLCLKSMITLDEGRAIETINNEVMRRLRDLGSSLLTLTAKEPKNERLNELDWIATKLYDLCFEAVKSPNARGS